MRERLKLMLAAFAILFFAACGILTLVLPDKDFSEDENRVLKQKPELTLKKVVKSDFQTELEEYFSDQVAFRTDFMKVYAATQIVERRTDYNGVYVCDDDWLIEVYEESKNTERNIERFTNIETKLSDMGVDCTLMLVPTAITLYPEVLPAGAKENNKQLEVMEQVYSQSKMRNINVLDTLKDTKESTQLYYKTDHHWTTDAAYACYVKYCDELGFTAQEKDAFDIKVVSDHFYGTIYSKALTPFQPYDKVKAYKQSEENLEIVYDDGKDDHKSLYSEEWLSKKDKYSYFLDTNNHLKIEVTNRNVNNGRVLLVVKDSYANCFVPFLVNHFEKVIVLNTRYYRSGVAKAAEQYGVTDALFLFNLNTFDTESAIAGIY
ncbi:MAG: hypothetical protein IKR27_09270 [Lachnospiraceae bacterium]|nr:hypothetical protein [Lachnospiraceae bacterium]